MVKIKQMVTQISEKPIKKSRKIPANLIRETLRGKSLYYKGYRDVINGNKQLEEIMGSSSLQGYLVSLLNAFIFNKLNRKIYSITTNETGLHLGKNNNLSTDLGIFLKEKIILNDKYSEVAPEIAIEVDVKIDTEKEIDYIFSKSEEMMLFGTSKILWILTKNKKIFVFSKGETTQVFDWHNEINILDDISLNLQGLLDQEGVTFE